MGIITNFQRNMRNATKDAFSSVGEDYNVNLESRDLQRISKSRMISEAKQIARNKLIDTDSGIFADFKSFGRNLKQQLFGDPNTNKEEMDSWDFDDIGFSASDLAGRSGLSAGALNDSARKSSEAIGGAVISGTNRQIKANSILMSGLINEVKVGNTLLKGILDSLNDKTFREASLKYYTESLLALKNIERGVQFQTEEKGKDLEDGLKPSEFAKQLASMDLHGITGTAKNVLMSVVDKQGMIKLMGGVASGLMESLMGEGGLKSMIKTGMEQLLKSKLGESFGADMETFMSDPALLMEKLLQRGKVSKSAIIRTFAKRTASTVNSAFDSAQETKDPKGKANFDIAAHTALTHVLPHKLDKIYAAITGTQLETYDYTKNRWITVEDAAALYSREKPDIDGAIGDVISGLKDKISEKGIKGFTDSKGELIFEKSLKVLMNGLASKGGELKGIMNGNAKAIADEYGISIPEAVRVMELVRIMMSDKEGNEIIASADRDILNLVNDVQAFNRKTKDSYSSTKLFQNGALDNVTLARGDDALGKVLKRTHAGGAGILSALAEVEGYGSVLKVFAVNGFGGGTERGEGAGGHNSAILSAVNNELNMADAAEKISKGKSVEFSNHLDTMNKMKAKENDQEGTKAERAANALQSLTDEYNAKHGTKLSPDEVKRMMEVYEYLRATGMGGPSIMQFYKDMNGGGSKDWDKWSEAERNKKINPQSWEDIDLSLFSDDVKGRAEHYTSKGSMTKKRFSIENPIDSLHAMFSDIYKDPNLADRIHGGAGLGLGAIMGTVLQKTTGIGGIYAPLIGSMLGGAMSMTGGFKSITNQLLGDSANEQIGGVKRKDRILEKVFQQVLPSVIGGSAAGKFAGKVIGKFLPYGNILGPVGSLVVGAITGGLLYQTNLFSKALGDTRFGKFMTKIPVIGKYFKVRDDEKEKGTTSTDASFKDLVYGDMKEDGSEYDSDKADENKKAYEDYNEVLKEFMEELAVIREEREDLDQDIKEFTEKKAEITAGTDEPNVKAIKIANLKREYAVSIKKYKKINGKLTALGIKYKQKLKDAIAGKIPDSKIDSLVDTAIATGFVKGSKDHRIHQAKGTFRGVKDAFGDTFKKMDAWLMGDDVDEDELKAREQANKDFMNDSKLNDVNWVEEAQKNKDKHKAKNKFNTGNNKYGAARKKNFKNPSSGAGEGDGVAQHHYYQKDPKWSELKSGAGVINLPRSGCGVMVAMSVASRLISMKINNPKYFVDFARGYINKDGIDSTYFEDLFSELGASVARYPNIKTMSTEAVKILINNIPKAWSKGGSVVLLIEQNETNTKHFVSLSDISSTRLTATLHDPNKSKPIDINIADLVPVIHEIIYIVPTKTNANLAYKKKIVTKDEMAAADYDVSGINEQTTWEKIKNTPKNIKEFGNKLTNTKIGSVDVGGLHDKFSNLGDDFITSALLNDEPMEGKIANALLYGTVGAVDLLHGTVKMVGKGISKAFKGVLKSMGPLGQLISVGWKLGMGAAKTVIGAGKLVWKVGKGLAIYKDKLKIKGEAKGKILNHLREIFSRDVTLRSDGTIVDKQNDSTIGKLQANGDVTDADGKNVIGNVPMDIMKGSGMDKSIANGGKKNWLGLIGEHGGGIKGFKEAFKTVASRRNKKLADAARENAEKANKFTRGETMFDDMRDALSEVLAETPIRTEVEGGTLDAVGATGASDVDATEEMIKSAESAPKGKKSPKVVRDLKAKFLRIKRALKGRTIENIDKFQDEEADREERKIAALEANAGGKSGSEGGIMKYLGPLLIGVLAPLAGMLPGLMAMYNKLTGNAMNLNQMSSLWNVAKGGGKLVGGLVKGAGKLVSKGTMKIMNMATFGGAGKIAGKFKNIFGKTGTAKGVDITLDAIDKVDNLGSKAVEILKSIFMWILKKAGKLIPASWMAKIMQFLPSIINMVKKPFTKLMTNPKVASAFGGKSIPFASIAFAIWDFVSGYRNAHEFLGLPEDAVNIGMKVAVSLSNGLVSVLAAIITTATTTLSGGAAIGVSMAANVVAAAINPGWLAKKIYNIFGDIDGAASKKLSKKMGKEVDVKTKGDFVSFSGNEQAEIKDAANKAEAEDRKSDSQSFTQRISNTFKNIFSPGDGNGGSNATLWNNITGNTEVDYNGDGTFPLPNPNSTISSTFGDRVHPTKGGIKPHKGIDFAVATGTPIYAMADGKITKADLGSNGAGLMVILEGKDGITYKYMHLHSVKVKTGQEVTKGQLIGTSGGDPNADGKNAGSSTGPHLHFQMEKGGTAFDPVKALQIDHSNIATGPNNKENEKYLAKNSNPKLPGTGEARVPEGKGGVDGMSREAEAALIAIPGLLSQLITAVKENVPKGESNGSNDPIDFNSLLAGMRGSSAGGTPII